jgi:hypothetical protein
MQNLIQNANSALKVEIFEELDQLKIILFDAIAFIFN